MVGPLGTLPGVTLGSVSGSIFCSPFQGTPGQNSDVVQIARYKTETNTWNDKLIYCIYFIISLQRVEQYQVQPLLTWWPADVGPIRHLVIGILALAPAVRGHQWTGRRVSALNQVIRVVGVIQSGFTWSTKVWTCRDGT